MVISVPKNDDKNITVLIYYHFSYQNGPDTYLLQLRDTDFPVRLREYMKVAYNRGTTRNLDDTYDWRVNT